MPLRIALAGKGGAGKTTLAALLSRSLMNEGLKPLLAVDADPNSCLAERLGVNADRTIGQLREELRADPTRVPTGMSKSEWVEGLINQEITESAGFDLIVMGRQEGPDCYCYINNLLRACLGKLGDQYRAVVIDNEAGLEHLSRRTDGRVEVMLVVCEPNVLGARTAQRITELIRSLALDIGHAYIVLNRCRGDVPADVQALLDSTGLEVIACVPDDPTMATLELEQTSLLRVPAGAPAAVAVDALLQRLRERGEA
ncbi:MAG: AAA family ATPase [bacterium]